MGRVILRLGGVELQGAQVDNHLVLTAAAFAAVGGEVVAQPARRKVWPEVLAGAGGPHEKPKRAFKLLARDLLRLCKLCQLIPELCQFACHKMQFLYV